MHIYINGSFRQFLYIFPQQHAECSRHLCKWGQGCVGPFKLPIVLVTPSLSSSLASPTAFFILWTLATELMLIDNCQTPNKMAAKWHWNGQKRQWIFANVPHMLLDSHSWNKKRTHFRVTFQLNGRLWLWLYVKVRKCLYAKLTTLNKIVGLVEFVWFHSRAISKPYNVKGSIKFEYYLWISLNFSMLVYWIYWSEKQQVIVMNHAPLIWVVTPILS